MKPKSSTETAEEAAAHELGHWVGLPHVWERRGGVIAITAKGKTGDNYMDYDIKRKKWFKIQLENTRR